MDKKDEINSIMERYTEFNNRAYNLRQTLAALLMPALKAMGFRGNANDIDDIASTMLASDRPAFEVSYRDYANSPETIYLDFEVAFADDPEAAQRAYNEAKRERQRIADAERVQAQRLKSYRDAGLSPEEINTIEAARIKLAVTGTTL